MAREVVTASAEETRALGATLARALRAGDVVLLQGELGAGKTTFVQGMARSLGVTATVRSPTFAILHRYRGAPDLVHIDLYREREEVSLEDLALEETDPAVIVVEWPRHLAAARWPGALRVEFEHLDPGHRLIRLPER